MIRIAASALLTALISALALAAPTCLAAEGLVTIVSPKGGATLNSKNRNKLVYDAAPGPGADHLHTYVDGEAVAQTRQLKGA